MCLIIMFWKLEIWRFKKNPQKPNSLKYSLCCCYSKFHLKGNAELPGCRTAGISQAEDETLYAIMQKKIVSITKQMLSGVPRYLVPVGWQCWKHSIIWSFCYEVQLLHFCKSLFVTSFHMPTDSCCAVCAAKNTQHQPHLCSSWQVWVTALLNCYQ